MKQPTTLEVALPGATHAPLRPPAPTLADSVELDPPVHDPPTWRDHVHNLKGLLICCDLVGNEELAGLHRRIRAELGLLHTATSRCGQHAVSAEMEARFRTKLASNPSPAPVMPTFETPAPGDGRVNPVDQSGGAKIRLHSALESLHRQLQSRPPAGQFARDYDESRLVA